MQSLGGIPTQKAPLPLTAPRPDPTCRGRVKRRRPGRDTQTQGEGTANSESRRGRRPARSPEPRPPGAQPRRPRRLFKNGNKPGPAPRPEAAGKRAPPPRGRPGPPREGSAGTVGPSVPFLPVFRPGLQPTRWEPRKAGSEPPFSSPSFFTCRHLRPPRPPEVTTGAGPAGVPSGFAAAAGRWRRREPWNGASWSSAALSAKGRGTFGNSQFAALVRKQPRRARSDSPPRAPLPGPCISPSQFILPSPHGCSPGTGFLRVPLLPSLLPSLFVWIVRLSSSAFSAPSGPVIPREPCVQADHSPFAGTANALAGTVKYSESAGGFYYVESGKLLSVTRNRFIHW